MTHQHVPSEVLPHAVYTATESADQLRCSLRRLRQLVKAGRLRPQGYVRQHLFLGEELIRFLTAHGGEE